MQPTGTGNAIIAFPRPLWPPPGGSVINLSIKPPLTVIAKPVLTLAVAIRIPVLFPFRPQKGRRNGLPRPLCGLAMTESRWFLLYFYDIAPGGSLGCAFLYCVRSFASCGVLFGSLLDRQKRESGGSVPVSSPAVRGNATNGCLRTTIVSLTDTEALR